MSRQRSFVQSHVSQPLLQPMHFDFDRKTSHVTAVLAVAHASAESDFELNKNAGLKRRSRPFERRFTVVTDCAERQKCAGNVSRVHNALHGDEVWPVKEQGLTVVSGERDGTPKSIENDAFGRTWTSLDRLKVAALTFLLSQTTCEFVIAAHTAQHVQQSATYLSRNKFDLAAAANEKAAFERELAAFNTQAQLLLGTAFKTILAALLSSFVAQNEPRFDRKVLSFVRDVDEAYYAAQAAFDYSDSHSALARQYVYSALHDGQLLQFDTPTVNLRFCARVGTQTMNRRADRLTPAAVQSESALETDRQEFDNALQTTLYEIERRTQRIMEQHKLFNRLLRLCTDDDCEPKTEVVQQCRSDFQTTVFRLCDLSRQHGSVWHFLRTSALDSEGAGGHKNLNKAVAVCCLALTSNFSQHTDALQQLKLCGFFDDILVLRNILDNGCLQCVRDINVRSFLMQQIVRQADLLNQLLNSEKLSVLQNSSNMPGDQIATKAQLMQRILWLLFLASVPLLRQEQKSLEIKGKKSLLDDGAEMLRRLYKWAASQQQLFSPLAAVHKTMHNFLLRHNQFRLCLIAQQQAQIWLEKQIQ